MDLTKIKVNKTAMKKIKKEKFSFERDIQKGYLKGIKVLSALLLATATLATMTALNPDFTVSANNSYVVTTKDAEGKIVSVDDVDYDASEAYKNGYEAGNQELERNPLSSVAGYVEFYNAGYNQGAIDIKNVLESSNTNFFEPNAVPTESLNITSVETNGMPADALKKLSEYKSIEQIRSELINSPVKLSIEDMNKAAGELGTFTLDGMTMEQYNEMMSYEVKDVTQKGVANIESFDIAAFTTYEEIEDMLKEYSKNENVSLSIIGSSAENRDIYSIEVGTGDKVIMLTGGVHSREPAGTSFIMKEISDLLIDYDTNAETRAFLEEFKIVAVPCANPDGRVVLENNPSSMLKANGEGTDLNRNFPAINVGQLFTGNILYKDYISDKPSYQFYPGDYCGSAPETQALIRFYLDNVEKTVFYYDYHQAGKVIYTSKYAGSAENEERHYEVAEDIIDYINQDGAGYHVDHAGERTEGCGNGEGSTGDFFYWLTEGAMYSPAFGRWGMKTEEGIVPLMFCEGYDTENIVNLNTLDNVCLATGTLEIGSMSSRGLTDSARKLQAQEYENMNMAGFLNFLMGYSYKKINGEDAYQEFMIGIDKDQTSIDVKFVEQEEALSENNSKEVAKKLIFWNDVKTEIEQSIEPEAITK